jgi:hypothetical protein
VNAGGKPPGDAEAFFKRWRITSVVSTIASSQPIVSPDAASIARGPRLMAAAGFDE